MTPAELAVGNRAAGPPAPTRADAARAAADQLPRPPGLLRQFWSQHPQLADVSVAGLATGLEVLAVLVREHVGATTGPLLLSLAGVTVCAVGLLLRRRHPWLGFGLVALVTVPLGTSPTQVGGLALAVSLFTIAAYVSPKAGWTSCLASVAATEVALLIKYALLITPPVPTGSPFTRLASTHAEMIPLTLTLLVATLLGVNAGNHKRYIAALVAHAAQLARERDQQAQLAAAAERSRIAREIHDIVAHSLSVMVRLADGAEAVLVSDPDRAQAVLEQIGKTGRSSLGEMRRVLGVLRDSDASGSELDPSPEVGDLAVLIGVYRKAGLPISWRIRGDEPTSAGVQLAVFRSVQEMLTNTLRHAVSPHDVDLDIDFRSGVTLTVVNDSAVPPTVDPGAGRGLIGIRERAALYGGTVECGPSGGNGWRVRVTLPEADRDR